jgi:hypothetical protein
MLAPRKPPNKPYSKTLKFSINTILLIATLITVITKFVPFSPVMPAAGLDPSWVFGMNQATANGLSIGREIIFTLGPYASTYTRSYHPSTDIMMISGSLYLALSYWACLVILLKGVQWRWILAFCIVFPGLMHSQDALFLSLPLLAGITTLKIVTHKESRLITSKWTPLYFSLIFSPLGLLPLVKGSFLILSVTIAILCSAFLIINRHRALATICLLSPMASIFFFWLAAGQSTPTLPDYFTNMIPIISGYTDAMAVEGNPQEIITYLMAAFSLLLAISFHRETDNISRVFLFCVYFVFLFLAFKAGFVRHDRHAIIAGASLLIASLLLAILLNGRVILLACTLASIAWLQINSKHVKLSAEEIINNTKSNYISAWNGIKNRIESETWPQREFDAATDYIRKKASIPILQGTTDIYSYNQSHLISSKNSWHPRPIFQSYSAYTSTLATINKQHLIGDRAPDNIIFRTEPIDGRLPSIEDGASWPVLLSNYRVTRLEHDFLYLRKDITTHKPQKPLKLASQKHNLGNIIDIPDSNQPLLAQILIKKTIWGHIASVLFKPSQLQITLELKNGSIRQYRFIASMTKAGFILSPLIENTAEFGLLYGERELLASKLVKSISIAPRDNKSSHWQQEYTIIFSQIKTDTPIEIEKLYAFDKLDNEASTFRITNAEKCIGSIGKINGTSPLHASFSKSNIITISGWLATAADQTTLADPVYVVFTDSKGQRSFLKTRATSRPDVARAFNNPKLNDSGYSSLADTSELKGKYTLGLAIKKSEHIEICPQVKIQAAFNDNSHIEHIPLK